MAIYEKILLADMDKIMDSYRLSEEFQSWIKSKCGTNWSWIPYDETNISDAEFECYNLNSKILVSKILVYVPINFAHEVEFKLRFG